MGFTVDFPSFKSTLLQHCRNTIENFSRTPDNRDVYAFVLDAQSTYGAVGIRWNTLEGLAQTLTHTSYQNYPHDRIYAYNGLKYSVGDYRFEDENNDELWSFSNQFAEELDEMWDSDDEEGERYRSFFIDMLVDVILELAPDFEKLHRTDDFIAYVTDHDEDDMAFMKRTIPDKQFYKAFPDIKQYEEFIQRIGNLPIAEQAGFWSRALVDFKLNNDSIEVLELKSMHRNEFDVIEQITALGSEAVGSIITMLEMFCGYRPFYDGVTRKLDVWTCQSILIDIAQANEDEIKRLQAILFRQYEEGDQGAINTARTLHALDPNRFPEEATDEGRLHLLNIDEYK